MTYRAPNVDIDHPKVIPEPNSGCWIWLGSSAQGYGRIYYADLAIGKTRTKAVHRAAYEFARGPIQEGMTLDHLCRNTFCVNPDHLEQVTSSENVKRGNPGIRNRRKTHCPHGHPYDQENTYYTKVGRMCVTCAKARSKAQTYIARAKGSQK